MSHFAKVDQGRVIQVISAQPEFFNTFRDTSPGQWIQTSYNTRGNVHYGADGQHDGGIPLRGNYAGVGYIYDSENDVFYPPQPFPSWTLNTSSWIWESPQPYPENDGPHWWDEVNQRWVKQV
jgi:hypothetical protein